MITNVGPANQHQMFRCIVSAPPCSDTTNAATLTVTTGIDKPAKKPSFSVYPNPSQDFMTIQSADNFAGGIYVLMDVYGRILITCTLASPRTKIDVSHLLGGICILTIRSTSGQIKEIIKVVLQ